MPKAIVTQVERIDALMIIAPEWFKRQDFVDFLNGKTNLFGFRPATWHQGGEEAEDISDVFTVYDHGDGPDAEGLPDDIWAAISSLCEEQRLEYAFIRISPA